VLAYVATHAISDGSPDRRCQVLTAKLSPLDSEHGEAERFAVEPHEEGGVSVPHAGARRTRHEVTKRLTELHDVYRGRGEGLDVTADAAAAADRGDPSHDPIMAYTKPGSHGLGMVAACGAA
jgi:hypothetical protein